MTLEVRVAGRRGGMVLEAEFVTPGAGITVLFGRSGAGKTTLVNMIAGLLRPASGRIAVGGRVLFDGAAGIDLPAARRRIGYVFQEGRLFPHLNVGRNLFWGRRGRDVADAGEAVAPEEVIDILDLGGLLERRPGTLSGGERQRVAIGRALLSRPALLLMDEPLASLDAPRKAEILDCIERLRDRAGLPVVWVTHALDEVVRLADRVVVLSDGRVVADGDVTEVMSRPDLAPATGRFEAGAVFEATVLAHDEADGLTTLGFAGGEMLVPRVGLPPGRAVRAHVRARDVSVALERPRRISVLNVFRGTVAEVGPGAAGAAASGPAVDLVIDIGVPLRARITARSVRELGLVPGREVYALVKAVALDGRSLGMPGARRRG